MHTHSLNTLVTSVIDDVDDGPLEDGNDDPHDDVGDNNDHKAKITSSDDDLLSQLSYRAFTFPAAIPFKTHTARTLYTSRMIIC